nr:hypothetical protein [Pandoravirus massiliensis]
MSIRLNWLQSPNRQREDRKFHKKKLIWHIEDVGAGAFFHALIEWAKIEDAPCLLATDASRWSGKDRWLVQFFFAARCRPTYDLFPIPLWLALWGWVWHSRVTQKQKDKRHVCMGAGHTSGGRRRSRCSEKLFIQG